MPLLANRIQETSTTTGTGTLTLAGAVTGYRTFNAAFANGNVAFYTIDDTLGNWEVGFGTVGSGTLTRDTVIESSNSGSKVSFGSGVKRVFCSAPTRALLPNQTSNSGKFLTSDGTSPSWSSISQMTYPSAGIALSTGSAWDSSLSAPSGALVGTTDSQILTNKTISGADNTLSNIANASLSNSSITFGATAQALGSTVLALNAVSLGQSTAAAGAFTTLSASSTVSGTGFSTYLASPPAIGGTVPAAGNFTTLGTTGNVTLGDASGDTLTINGTAVSIPNNLNFDSNTLFIDAANNRVGIGTSSPSYPFQVRNDHAGTTWISPTNLTATGAFGAGVINLAGSSGYYSYFQTSADGNLSIFNSAAGYISITNNGAERLRIDSAGNVGIGTATFGTSAANVFSIGSGTAPTTGPADTVQFYSSDRSAGNTIPSFFCEGTGVITANTTAAATHRIAMRINGTIYYFLANTAA